MKSINHMTKGELLGIIIKHLRGCKKFELREYIRYGLNIEYKE